MTDEAQTAPQGMPGPGPEHDRFGPFIGTFRAVVELWMGPGEPTVTTGTMVNTLDLGGRYLRQDYKGDPGEGPFPEFEGHGFWGYNTVTHHYESFWIDNASTMMQFELGSVDEGGKVWTMVSELADPRGGTMTKRSVITLLDDDHHTMESFFAKDGEEFKAMEMRYARAE